MDGTIKLVEGDLLKNLGIDIKNLVGREFVSLGIWHTDDSNTASIKEAFRSATRGEVVVVKVKLGETNSSIRYIELNLIPNFEDEEEESSVFFGAIDVSSYQFEIDIYKERCDYFLFAAESAGVGLSYWDIKGEDIYSTPTCNALFDLAPGEPFSTEHFYKVLHPDDKERVQAQIGDAKQKGSSYNIQYRVVHADDNIVWISAKGRTFCDEEGNVKTMMGCVTNINESKSVNEELERIYDREKKARNEAEIANRTKDFFLAMVSHELRSPINAILGWTKILLENSVDDETRVKALKTIEKSSRSQADLIDDLLDSARITSGKLKLECRPLDLTDLLENVISIHLPSIEVKEITFDFNPSEESLHIFGDSDRLTQVFSNILGNAVKFTNEKGQISVEIFSCEDEVKIIVKDNGKGIRKEHLPFIFRQFTQGHEKFTGKNDGLGLGLSLAQILAQMHKGSIAAESEGPDTGAEFTVTLPLLDSISFDEYEVEREHADEPRRKANALENARIMIVEDDEDSRHVLEIFLDQLGASVLTAESVDSALEQLESVETAKPDIIISDIGMPEKDGYYLAEWLKNSSEFNEIPAIALSAFTAQKNKKMAYESGFKKYHTKPFDPDLLVTEILALLEKE